MTTQTHRHLRRTGTGPAQAARWALAVAGLLALAHWAPGLLG